MAQMNLSDVVEITTVEHQGYQKDSDKVNDLLKEGWRIIAITPIGFAEEYRVGDGAHPYSHTHIVLGKTGASSEFCAGDVVEIDPPDDETKKFYAVLLPQAKPGNGFWRWVEYPTGTESPGVAHEEIMRKVEVRDEYK